MIAYFDCSSGISGDMVLGALIDAGLSPQKLKKGLSCLPVKGYKLNIKAVKRAGLLATKVDVKITQNTERRTLYQTRYRGTQSTGARRFKDVERIIKKSSLSKDIKQKGLAIFRRLFEAEAMVHGERFDRIHLHELGSVDCIIDIFGALIGLDILGVKKIYSSPLNLGGGNINTEHGVLPVPAPATAELLRNVPVYSSGENFELTTPTGAGVISTLAEHFGAMPHMKIFEIGVGAGNRDFKKQPNVLRLFTGKRTEPRAQIENKVTVIETNIDDMNPQIYEYVIEKLLKSGALDVFLTQIIMKKGRPGVKLTVLCTENKREELIKVILEETTSIGLRFYRVERKVLQRTIQLVDTKFGKVRVKVLRSGDDVLRMTPEYEDCKKIAKKFKLPFGEVIKRIKI